MNLVDELLKADVKKAEELETGVFKSRRLAKILETDEPVDVKIREIKARRLNDIAAHQIDSNGKVDFSKVYDTSLIACVEGCVEPDLRDKNLQQHFGCDSAIKLAEMLFGMEAKDISSAISELSGVLAEENEEEIKN